MDDLYPDSARNFVFGEASPRDRVGVCSFARYLPQTGAAGASLLRKLQHSIGFDVAGRYRRLRTFAEDAGFTDEARWLIA